MHFQAHIPVKMILKQAMGLKKIINTGYKRAAEILAPGKTKRAWHLFKMLSPAFSVPKWMINREA